MATRQTDFRDLLGRDAKKLMSEAEAAKAVAVQAMKTASAAEQLAKLSRIDFGQFTIAYQALVSVNPKVDDYTLTIPDAKVGDRLIIYPSAEPSGYALVTHARLVTIEARALLKVWRPALAIAANVSFPVKIIAYRDPSA